MGDKHTDHTARGEELRSLRHHELVVAEAVDEFSDLDYHIRVGVWQLLLSCHQINHSEAVSYEQRSLLAREKAILGQQNQIDEAFESYGC